ncbi:hypothetical protein VT84_09590 [Gemmata sp. SH-PL17]|uniref:hypothetical protein n=1 Tax=Gemmata sp. SH-PL17 TaxID=1630693 RepID=UPI00078C4388|nr:hypothetical protein [Gemmata sp. SH-PL17]AMV24637.1 hypothetical protein VT84_09590 [Gemmata sp. SH-PL17]
MTATETRPNAVDFDWVPALPSDTESSPIAGYLRIYAARATTLYRVEEFPADEGRGFQLVKSEHTAGTDREAAEYAVFAGRDGRTRCECRGFLRWSHCKHQEAVAELLDKGQL